MSESEEKSSLTIDAAEITKEALDGIADVVPVLDKHPRGVLSLIALVLLVGGIVITVTAISRQPIIGGKEPSPPSDAGAVRKIEGDEHGDKVFRITN